MVRVIGLEMWFLEGLLRAQVRVRVRVRVRVPRGPYLPPRAGALPITWFPFAFYALAVVCAPLTSTPYPATPHAQVYVMPWLWYARVVLYLLLSVPGYFTAYGAGYMPGLIGALDCTSNPSPI